MCGTIHLIIFAATVDIHTGDGSIITQMDYFTLAVSRLDHGLNTFLLSMDVLLNACIPIVSAKYCYAAHESRLHQNDRCKRFTLCLVLTVRFRSLAPWGKLFQLFI